MHDPALTAVVRRQLGLVTRQQARAAGLTPRQIEQRLRSGAWQLAHPNVYRLSVFPTRFEQRALAALLALGPEAALSHRAALTVWGVRGFSGALVEVSIPDASHRRLENVIVHRSPDLGKDWTRFVGPLVVTGPARTLVDLGAVVSPWLVKRCLEEWMSRRLVRFEEVEAAIAEHRRRGRRGVGVLRAVLEGRALASAAADSPVEALLADILALHGVPLPVHHHLVWRDDVVVAELDYAYPQEKVALEVDGYGVHLRSQRIFERDRLRQNELEIEGWAVLRFASTTLMAQPRLAASQVSRLLAARRSLLWHDNHLRGGPGA